MLFFVVWSCDRYEYISDSKRFNKRSGEVELLTGKGWKSLKKVNEIISKGKEDFKKEQVFIHLIKQPFMLLGIPLLQ